MKRPLKLKAQYLKEVQLGHIKLQNHQLHILQVMEGCWQQSTSWLAWFRQGIVKKHLYIYGSVGSGKTYLMDMFYQALPTPKKWRIHFHAFLEYVSDELKKLQGQVNPMQQVVQTLAKHYQVLCLDEMMVQDVVQAMLLRELVPALMAANVLLVFTSNIAPQDLYTNGLQRPRFMLVIEHIENFCHVLHLQLQQDFRQGRLLKPEEVFFTEATGKEQLKACFEALANTNGDTIEEGGHVMIEGRQVEVIAKTKSSVWFDAKVIAAIPRCQRDYLSLVKTYPIVFISGLDAFASEDVSAVILWMHLVDVFYDAKMKLILASNTNLDHLYPEGPMKEPFKRCLSRLKEMQSSWYWEI
ncbi:MAG: cell division protein ZapE [Gammaproteobacteria bacterium]|nr:cell division protein ZapE [Gammaproteobacteria bacterium]